MAEVRQRKEEKPAAMGSVAGKSSAVSAKPSSQTTPTTADLDLDQMEAEAAGPIPLYACAVSGLASSSCIVWCITWCALALMLDNKQVAVAVTQTLGLFITLTAVPLFTMVLMEVLIDWPRRTLTRGGRFILFIARLCGAAVVLAIIKYRYLSVMFPDEPEELAASA